MKRIATVFGSCLLMSLACGPGSEGAVDERSVDEEFIGGWDAEGSGGSAILLIREGLIGTLNVTSLSGRERQFHVVFDVQGQVEEESLMLGLNCAEARERSMLVNDDDATDEPSTAADEDESDDWVALDCSGWDLELQCSIAGECNTGDCNMVCDVVYFGDAYAHSEIELGSVEDAFDYWQRV